MQLMTDLNDRVVVVVVDDVSVAAADVDCSNNSVRLNSVLLI
jgi:hypothetical protein